MDHMEGISLVDAKHQFDELVCTLLPVNAPEECRAGKKPADTPTDS